MLPRPSAEAVDEESRRSRVGVHLEGAWIFVAAWLRERRAGLSISAAIHALLLAAAAIVFPVPPLSAPPPEALTVELIEEAAPARLATVAPPSVTNPVRPPKLDVPPVPASPAVPRLTHARTILSGGALDRIASASLRSLDGGARVEQLCGIEAMEQIAKEEPHFNPERIIAYATADTRSEGATLIAEGAAFLSDGHWYRLAYRCLTSPDRRRVLSFDYATGEQLPDDNPALPTGGDD